MTRFISLTSLLLLTIFNFFPANASSDDKNGQSSSKSDVFIAAANPMLEVEVTLNKAKQNNKLALIVLGAQWCHDSTGLAEKFDSPEMKLILASSFETVYIDVGYLQDRRDITQRFGQANYYATPTVLIVNPETEQLLNGNTLQKWGFADSVPVTEYTEYFAGFNNSQKADSKQITQEHSTQIEQFKSHQSERLMKAYTVLRPDLKADVEKAAGTDYDPQFVERWVEVRKFRLKLQKDIQQLYVQASNHPQDKLNLPLYEKFSFE